MFFKGIVCRISVQLHRLDQDRIFVMCIDNFVLPLFYQVEYHLESVETDKEAACNNKETGYNTTKKHRHTLTLTVH